MSGIGSTSGINIHFQYPKVNFKAKRGSHRQQRCRALPEALPDFAHVGHFTGWTTEVTNIFAIRNLHKNGCFGVSSVTKSTPRCMVGRVDPEEVEKLLLFPEEAFFLSYFIKCLKIRKGEEILTDEQCLEEFTKIHPGFISSFVAYTHLRSLNWVVKSGIKFGGDFRGFWFYFLLDNSTNFSSLPVIYRRGPEFFHASYLVLVRTGGQTGMNAVELQCIHRISQTSGKDVLLLEVSPKAEGDFAKHLENRFRDFRVSESIPKRFILK